MEKNCCLFVGNQPKVYFPMQSMVKQGSFLYRTKTRTAFILCKKIKQKLKQRKRINCGWMMCGTRCMRRKGIESTLFETFFGFMETGAETKHKEQYSLIAFLSFYLFFYIRAARNRKQSISNHTRSKMSFHLSGLFDK